MMIVVFRDEVQMVDQAHGLFEPRMWDLSGEQRSLKPSNSIDELQAGMAELGQDLLKLALIMPRFVSFSIVQVSDGEPGSIRQVVVNSRHPQRLEVEQMSGMLLRRPFSIRFLHQLLMGISANHLLQLRRRTSQTYAQIRIQLHRKRKFEFPLKPVRNSTNWGHQYQKEGDVRMRQQLKS